MEEVLVDELETELDEVVEEVGAEPQPWSPGHLAFLQSNEVVEALVVEELDEERVVVELVGAEPQP